MIFIGTHKNLLIIIRCIHPPHWPQTHTLFFIIKHTLFFISSTEIVISRKNLRSREIFIGTRDNLLLIIMCIHPLHCPQTHTLLFISSKEILIRRKILIYTEISIRTQSATNYDMGWLLIVGFLEL